MSQWFAIDGKDFDVLPRERGTVLGGWWSENSDEWQCEVVIFYGAERDRDYWFDSLSDPGMWPPVSHWMPLPDPPERTTE